MSSHRKVKSVAKRMVTPGPELDKIVLNTMKTVSDLVGSTLGPGGKVVAIERQEFGIPDLVTKDGVTVFRSLGFQDPVAHSIMGLARDASVRTANEAGDGTTTATVLAEAFVRYTQKFCHDNPTASPQRVVRTIEQIFRKEIEPFIKGLKLDADQTLLRAVALCSANGDTELADAVAKCFELIGDAGNVTITEATGNSSYKVEQVKGYAANIGFEDCVGKFFSIFVNDSVNNRVYLDKPVFVLYHGTVTDFGVMVPLLTKVGDRWGGPEVNSASRNVVIIATGFAPQVIEDLAGNWPGRGTINVYPLIAPKNAMQSGQLDFLQDLASITSSTIFDPVTKPAQNGQLSDIGPELTYFEATRYRSNIVGQADEGLVLARIEEIEAQLPNAEGLVEKNILNERKGKISGGIARLTVVAPTNGELRERRDRAEDAICAWRGAADHGALPGGCWTFSKLDDYFFLKYQEDGTKDLWTRTVVQEIICPAIREPVRKLLSNCGYTEDKIVSHIKNGLRELADGTPCVFDALQGLHIPVAKSGVVDSLPAVLEALRNAISIAMQLGTLGGVVVFPRDPQLEREEASDTYDFMRNGGLGM